MFSEVICTIGPSSGNEKVFLGMAKAGMTIARSNMSHCTRQEYTERLELIKLTKKKLGKDIKMLADLQGPRIRVKNIPSEGRQVNRGEFVTFVTSDGTPVEGEIGIDDPYLHSDVKVGDRILIANGAIESVVVSKNMTEHRIVAEILNDGIIYPNKALNLPMTKLTTSCLTDKDREDIKFLKDLPMDYIALSFVQSADDIKELRRLLGDNKAKILAKIERKEALVNIDEIISEADGIMVARGDLGVEIPAADVPIMQKSMIRKCHRHLKPVIVATQMLLSMVQDPFPTRAEISDIANAIFDGAHAVMLSDETANGKFPVEATETLATTAARIEKFLNSEI